MDRLFTESVCCRMPLWQKTQHRLFETDLPRLRSRGPPCQLQKAFWRLDIDNHLPLLVVHLNQEYLCQLLYHDSCVDPEDSNALFVCVDLPDSVIFKPKKKQDFFPKFFSSGATQVEKVANLQLSSLRRTLVVDHTLDQVPGFPNVVLRLRHSDCPPLKNLFAAEAYKG